LRSCRISLALNIVIRAVVAAGMMMMGVRDPEISHMNIQQINKFIFNTSILNISTNAYSTNKY
jgi:hypothetical protein